MTPTKQPSAEMMKIAELIAEGINKLGWSPDVPNDKGYMKFQGNCHECLTIAEDVATYLAAKAADHAETLMKAAPEFDEKAADKIARRNCPNAYCSLNEVDSDVDYYSDIGKSEGVLIGARWQHQQSAAQIAALQQENERLRAEVALAKQGFSDVAIDYILEKEG